MRVALAIPVTLLVACTPDPVHVPDPERVKEGAVAVIEGRTPVAVDPVHDDCALMTKEQTAQLPGLGRTSIDVDTGVVDRSARCEFVLGPDPGSGTTLSIEVTDRTPADVIEALTAGWDSNGWAVAVVARNVSRPAWSVCLHPDGVVGQFVRCADVIDAGATLVLESVNSGTGLDLPVITPASDAFVDATLRRVGLNLEGP